MEKVIRRSWNPTRQIGSVLASLSVLSALLKAADRPQWGQAWSRNMVSQERGLPDSFDPGTGRNLKWSARLGSETHSTPVIAGGRVYIGTNNDEPRDPQHQGDRGVLMCFGESDGKLLWQLVVPKRDEDIYFDWPRSGIASPATVEGDRVYIVSNRGEVLCLDANGLTDGNDGPFRDEGRHMTPHGKPPLKPGPMDADILWLFDLTAGAGIWSHDAAHSSILIDGAFLYLNTGTGVDNTHKRIRRPNAPSIVVLDKATGRLLAREREGIAPNIFHGTWSAPSIGRVGGRRLVFFAAGNGILYAFDPIQQPPPPGQIRALNKVWEFDFDPTAPKERVHRYHLNRRIGPSNFYGMPVFYRNRLYLAGGGDLWWGKKGSWLKCIDAAPVLAPGRSRLIWTRPLGSHVMSTPAVDDQGLVFIADTNRQLYCVDAGTGRPYWVHRAKGDFWASPFVADRKVYIGTRRGDFWVFADAREKRVLSEIDLDTAISATATAANGVLYVATMTHLYAVARSAPEIAR